MEVDESRLTSPDGTPEGGRAIDVLWFAVLHDGVGENILVCLSS